MLPVRKAKNPDLKINLKEEFDEYYEKFELEDMQVIEFGDTGAGRLRIEKSLNEIYIGGIQILPKFQNKGIGSAIFEDLIKESEELKVPIRLKVAKIKYLFFKSYLSFFNLNFLAHSTVWN